MSLRLIFYLLFLMISATAYGKTTALKACYADWPPYSYTSKGKAAGLSIEIYNAILKRAKIKVIYTKKPWVRCRAEFAAGNMDILVDGGSSIPNALYIEPGPVLWILTFWVHRDSKLEHFKGYLQFNSESVGYVRGYEYPNEFIDHQGFKQKYGVSNDLQGLKMLDKGRLQAFFGDVVNCTFLVDSHQLKLSTLKPAVQTKFLTLSFAQQHIAEHADFNKAFNMMLYDGSIDAIYEKHLGITYHDLLKRYGG